jgi:O-antigen/teichoic acid export membrane protein
MKATSIFGGVQVFNIIILLVRSKAVAILLGTAGMGIMSLLTTTISLISSLTNFGLGTTAVKEISEAHSQGDQNNITEKIAIVRKLFWLTGIFGMVATIALSPFLSKITFGNYDYTLAFLAISITFLVAQLANSKLVLLQGFRQLKWLAKANLFASFFSVLISLPLYYYFGIHGIVPAIIVSAFVVLGVQYYFANKLKFSSYNIHFKQAIKKGKPMLKMGFLLSISGLFSVLSSYIIRLFISNFGTLEIVGLFNAGFTIINVYVGMVFTAMSTDYYPRLAAVQNNRLEYNKLINQQSEIALIILAPMICVFLIYINWIVIILYSESFLPITEMIHWAIMGIFFKAISWSIGYLILAKGDSKGFFWNELIANCYLLIFNIMGFYLGGLMGLGISFLVGYFIHFVQIYLYGKLKYGFQFEKNHIRHFVMFLFLGILGFLISINFTGLKMYVFGTLLILTIGLISLFLLNRKLDLVTLIQMKFKK